MDQLRIYAAYRKLRDARLADIQSGGKAVTRAEEKQLKLKLLQSPNSEVNLRPNNSVSILNEPVPSTSTAGFSNEPVPSTSTGGFTGPPLPKAYKKTAKKNIVSKKLLYYDIFLAS